MCPSVFLCSFTHVSNLIIMKYDIQNPAVYRVVFSSCCVSVSGFHRVLVPSRWASVLTCAHSTTLPLTVNAVAHSVLVLVS